MHALRPRGPCGTWPALDWPDASGVEAQAGLLDLLGTRRGGWSALGVGRRRQFGGDVTEVPLVVA